ncbi:C40 family peptidase [Yersinia ruckeri]|uniref:C40 family peptidase n=1 Tax=Yersinia ruckeri TaxID=29486 RepID=UPI001F44920A|nr:NlpC/P60 family protein [Yersinia ruckeri]UIN00101.1 C40 family peptidase [Yersinia ruckeri]
MVDNDILAHAVRCAPAESCGYVVRTAVGEQYFPCDNVSPDPIRSFRIRPEAYLQAQALGAVIALVHSHPEGEPCLSTADRTLQIRSDLPWWLVSEGHLHRFPCVPPLLGRTFEHGVCDCYTLFRDAYALAGLLLPDFPREEAWWTHGQNLYLDNLTQNGFAPIAAEAAQPGDILLCCFGTSVANHAAIYCGDGELLHHIPDQLSKRERYTEPWQRRTHSLWRHPKWHESAFTGIYNDLAIALT